MFRLRFPESHDSSSASIKAMRSIGGDTAYQEARQAAQTRHPVEQGDALLFKGVVAGEVVQVDFVNGNRVELSSLEDRGTEISHVRLVSTERPVLRLVPLPGQELFDFEDQSG